MGGRLGKIGQQRRCYGGDANPFESPAQKEHFDMGAESEELNGKCAGQGSAYHQPAWRYRVGSYAERNRSDQLGRERDRT